MIKRFTGLAALGVFIFLAGCEVANMQLGSTNTERGFIATRDLSLGQVFLWSPGSQNLRSADRITPENSGFYHDTTNGRDTTINFTGSASFAGGVKGLSAAQIASLEIEAARRATLATHNTVTREISSPINALVDQIRAAPDRWGRSLEIEDGIPSGPDASLVVVLSKTVVGDSLSLALDNGVSAGGEFQSQTVAVKGVAVKFKIGDAGNVTIAKSGTEPVSLFQEFTVLQMRQGANGPRFVTVKDDAILASLGRALTRGQ